jgi:hypothetical protein
MAVDSVRYEASHSLMEASSHRAVEQGVNQVEEEEPYHLGSLVQELEVVQGRCKKQERTHGRLLLKDLAVEDAGMPRTTRCSCVRPRVARDHTALVTQAHQPHHPSQVHPEVATSSLKGPLLFDHPSRAK